MDRISRPSWPPPVECLAAAGVDVDALSERERSRAVEILDAVTEAVLDEAPRATREAWTTGRDVHPLAVRAAVLSAARLIEGEWPLRPGSPILTPRERAHARRVALFGGYLPHT